MARLSPIVDIHAVEGKTVNFPCDVKPPGYDKVYMVFWFRDDAGIPLYSFDVRGKALSLARHWSAPKVFGSRAYFRTVSEPAQLVVSDIKRHDEGVYRCRVDFKNAQTRSFRYNLTIIVPPEAPTILDRWGRKLNSTVGPHEEGDDVILTCRTIGGHPEPKVRWLVNGVIVDDEYEHNAGDVIENRLHWPSVSRRDLDTIFTCQAINTLLTEPNEASVFLDILLKPLTVQILSRKEPFIADRRYEVKCESSGSRPPAIITWFKGKKQLKRTMEEIKENITLSVLSFIPTPEDNGKIIVCHAENPKISKLFQETTWKIDVFYPPIVFLSLGSTLNPNDIKEGDDVYFECQVKSNPLWRKLSWIHNGIVLAHNMSARIIRSNQSLVLQKVTRQSSGKYMCSAINSEGETLSNLLEFNVLHAPVCSKNETEIVGASIGEKLKIPCIVLSNPNVIEYRWRFNNSGEILDVSGGRYQKTSNSSMSILNYSPSSMLDYGTFSCMASNPIGRQDVPCLFQVIPAGRPQAVNNCTLLNQTRNSVQISCDPGFDGGLEQHFFLELLTPNTLQPYFNLTTKSPFFVLSDLQPDISFRVAIYAVNAKGRSRPAIFEDLTFTDAEKRIASLKSLEITPIFGILMGAIITIFIPICYLALKLKRIKSYRHSTTKHFEERMPSINSRHKMPSDSSKLFKCDDNEDIDPDLIPLKYGATDVGSKVVLSNQTHLNTGQFLKLKEDNRKRNMFHFGHHSSDFFNSTQKVNSEQYLPESKSTLNYQPQEKCKPLTDNNEQNQYLKSLKVTAKKYSKCEIEINEQAIKERLMTNHIPESCV